MTDSEPLDGAEAARRLRERAPDTVFVRSSSKNASRRLHMPAPDGDHHLCADNDGEDYGAVREVDLAAFPPGYYPWCARCAREALDRRRGEIVGSIEHPGVAADGGDGE